MKSISILTALGAAVALSMSSVSAKDGDEKFKREQGEKLLHLEGKAGPLLDVDDWQNSKAGALKLADLKGKVVVLDFWGTW